MPDFSPGSEWLLPTEIVPAAATGEPPALLAAGVDGAGAPLAGALDAAGLHAASSDGAAARPATPARPPRTRRLVSTGLAGDGSLGERGVSRFAMVSSSDLPKHGRTVRVRTNSDRIARIVLRGSSRCQDFCAIACSISLTCEGK
jgi:hypothetical protein